MANENNQKLMEDAEDEGLKAVMGSKFQDVSREQKASAPKVQKKAKEDPALIRQPSRAATFPRGEGLEVPTFAPNWFDKLKGCGKYAMVCGLLVALFGYWHISGQMDASAAVPCMVACGTIGGFKIGNVCRR